MSTLVDALCTPGIFELVCDSLGDKDKHSLRQTCKALRWQVCAKATEMHQSSSIDGWMLAL
jgi:hypothetical protein